MSSQQAQQAVQDLLDKVTAAEDGPVGVVFGAVDKNGNVLVKTASGYEELGNESRKMKTDSVFCMYSCTKMIAGIALMQLVEQGKIDLDKPVDDILPEVANATLANGSKPKNKITLRMLLSHTSGFSYTFFHPDLKKWSEKNNGLDEFATTKKCLDQPLIAEPGEDWNYSIGIDWAGEYLHRVTGKTLGEYCQENIFDPLGCTDIGFGLQPQHKGRLVAMHQRGTDGKMSVRDHLDFTLKGADFDSGGAGCIGTIDDYMKVMVVLLNKGVGGNGKRIIKEETLAKMFEDQLTKFNVQGDPMNRLIPDVTPELTLPIQMMPGVGKGWGLTFQILKDPLPTGRKAGSVWWAGLCNNYWCADPESGVATMILSQSFPFNDPKVIMPWLGAETEVYKTL